MLLENIAPNAFYDSEARFDPPKCDEDTRVEVIGELMDWMNDRENPQRLLCMTGAAGAGKSALQQTIAERCADARILGVAFFFSSLWRSNVRFII
jgi:DNA replication protein DnaC